MRVNNDGSYDYCRWIDHKNAAQDQNLRSQLPSKYFQETMAPVRQAMLDGQRLQQCGPCHRMEQHHKVSGRQKQLLKIGVQTSNFSKTIKSSAWMEEFQTSGVTDLTPQDWQIDLGNYCNSACVFCSPVSSSKLAAEFKKIGLIDSMPPANWTDDSQLLDRFLDDLAACAHVRYLHFIGGETLITPAFGRILSRLIDLGLNQSATIGFTTNLTVWDDDIVALLTQFHQVNLGMSMECMTAVNDYVRWPSRIDQVRHVLDRWLALAAQHDWYVQMRVTPTVLTIHELLSVHEFAIARGVAVESCNFLEQPLFLKPIVLPPEHRQPIIDRMRLWLDQQGYQPSDRPGVINIRNPDFAETQVLEDAYSYLLYLENQPDESYRLPDLVRYLRQLDRSRKLSVIDYLPQYETLFRSAGY